MAAPSADPAPASNRNRRSRAGKGSRARRSGGSPPAHAAGRSTKRARRDGGTPAGPRRSGPGSRRDRRSSRRYRYRVHYDVDGPRVRLGIAWFLLVVVAVFLGAVLAGTGGARLGLAAVYGVCAAAAATQTLRAWQRRRRSKTSSRAATLLCGVASLLVVLAAAWGPTAMGSALLVLTAAIVLVMAQRGARRPLALLGAVSRPLQAVLPPTLAAGLLVLLAGIEIWAAVALFLLVSGYEVGDFLVGSGSKNPAAGPLAGVATVAVLTIAVAASGLPPFTVADAAVFGAVAAVLAPLGQLLASAMLPQSRAPAPALRRIDSLLLSAPLWYAGVDLFLV